MENKRHANSSVARKLLSPKPARCAPERSEADKSETYKKGNGRSREPVSMYRKWIEIPVNGCGGRI
jgi:hypothetical protein